MQENHVKICLSIIVICIGIFIGRLIYNPSEKLPKTNNINNKKESICTDNYCLNLEPEHIEKKYSPFILNIGSPDNSNIWYTNTRYCFENSFGDKKSCIDMKIENGRINPNMVAIDGYYCNTSNNKKNYECHINASQVPDIQYDKNGNPVNYVCTPKGTFEDSKGDCNDLAKNIECKTAFCSYIEEYDRWETNGDQESQWLLNFIRCEWMRYNNTDYLDKLCKTKYYIPR